MKKYSPDWQALWEKKKKKFSYRLSAPKTKINLNGFETNQGIRKI